MRDEKKTKKQLIDELVEMRRRIEELGASGAERKRTEGALQDAYDQVKQSRDYLETFIEGSMDAIIATNREGEVVLFNPGAEALLGYKREEVIGQHVTMLYESKEQPKAVMIRMREGGGTVSNFEVTKRAKDGTLIPAFI